MSGEGFLTRWSRRKRAEAEGRPLPEALAPPAAAPAPVEPAPPPAAPEAPAFDPASLPDPATLGLEDDLRPFLRPEVPAALRQAALRRIWSLDPAIRDFIGPADYAWDFNAPDGGMAGFAPTLVGDVGRLLAQAIGAPLPREDDAVAADPAAPESPPLLAEAPATEPPPALPAPDPVLAEAAPLPAAAPAAPPPRPRRHGGALPA